MVKKEQQLKQPKSNAELAREALISNINKTFKTDIVRKFTITEKMARVSTSYFLLDDILGGGIPEGRIIEIFGWESSGKSFLTTKIMAAAQAQGKSVMLFDAENGFSWEFAKQCGLNVENKFIYSDEQTANTIFETIRMTCNANAQQIENGEEALFDIIVVDSVATLLTDYEEAQVAGKAQIGDLAKTMAQGLKKLPGIASKGKTTVIFINQVREKIGVLYGNPETTPGGNALKFYSSLRLQLRRLGGADGKIYGDNKELIGHKVTATVVKNKTAPPHRKATFSIFYDGKTDDTEDIFELAEKYNLWQKTGNVRIYIIDTGQELRENGKPKMLESIRRGGEALRDEFIQKIKDKMRQDGSILLSSEEMEEVKQEEESLNWDSEDDEKYNLDKDLENFDEE